MQVLNFPSPYQPGESPYQIFKDRMAAITQIIQGIKGRILNKYEMGMLNTTIEQINKALSPDQATEAINLLNADPGESIYPDEEKMNVMAGQFVDTFNVMGNLLSKKESVMGGLPSMKGIAPTPGTPPSTEVMIPKGDKMQLLDTIMNMPEGQMDFKPILDYMQEHRPKLMGSMSSTEKWVMEQAMGQISDPKKELSEGLDLAKKYKEYFEEPKEEKPNTELEYWLQEHPGEGVEQYWKAKKEPETPAQILKDVTDYLDSIYKTGNAELFNEEAKKLGIPTTFDTYGQKYEKPSLMANQYFKTANEVIKNSDKIPGYRIDPTLDKDKGWYANYTTKPKPTPPDELKDLTGSDINTFNKIFYEGDDGWGAITPEQYEEAVTDWKSMKKNKPSPEHLDILEKALRYCLDLDNKIISRGEENKPTKEFFEAYEWIYPYYKDALKGQSPKYLPPEEIKKVGAIEGALTPGGVQRGDYGSALVGEGKEKDEKGYIVGETYRDEEGVLWKYLGNDKWEEVEEKSGGSPRKR